METAGLITGCALGGPVLLVMILLTLPCEGRLRWSRGYETPFLAWSLSLLGGLVSFHRVTIDERRRTHVRVLGRTVRRHRRRGSEEANDSEDPTKTNKARRPRRKKKTRSKDKHDWSATDSWFWLGHTKLIHRWLILVRGCIRDLGAGLHLKPIMLTCRLGLGDPASTGMAYGYLWSWVGGLMGFLPFQRLVLEPEWFAATFATAGRIALRARPSDFLVALARLAIRAPWVRTIKVARSWKAHKRTRDNPARLSTETEG